ncbi:hypothetical protein LY01_01090 [Nonlabens xylanidelens]|uniref:Uncharacterized protein n=1 Tax=Nonlabens xylanidelens TaxID=191564 RepID=A0A2S6IML7_9FLAO|nr:hypothetical protein [Nonlabens xylanidelens]PPK95502.1 hypothetical protein LY01_01090 [Nonlabens xylanidelens]
MTLKSPLGEDFEYKFPNRKKLLYSESVVVIAVFSTFTICKNFIPQVQTL